MDSVICSRSSSELEVGKIEYKTAEDFLISLKKKFGGGEKESVKAAELRKIE